jgi:hypothetical protein
MESVGTMREELGLSGLLQKSLQYANFIDVKAPAWLTVTLAVAWVDRIFLLMVTVAGIHKR